VQLDTTAIVIAQRSADELFDLSLVVIRNYWMRLLPLGILGALPFFAINLVLLYPLTEYDRLVMASTDYATTQGFQLRYLWMMVVLVFLQCPLAMAGITYFLGQAVFIEQPTLKQVLRVVASRWRALLWVLGILRGGLVCLGYMVWIFLQPELQPRVEHTVYVTLYVVLIYAIRGFRPFAPEILLLERCPLRKSGKGGASEPAYGKRSRWLHAGSGDLFSVQIGLTVLAVCFVLAFSLGGIFTVGVLVGLWRWGWWMDMLIFPAVLWMMAMWATVIRFLLYLNTRIRSEGWEVELKLKAESQRNAESTGVPGWR
jgi:hypothetical protein